MARIIFELSGFFFVPFLAYAAFLIVSRRNPAGVRAVFERKALVIQAFIGLLIMAAVLLAFGLSDEAHRGAYSPAVFKDGKLVPGHID